MTTRPRLAFAALTVVSVIAACYLVHVQPEPLVVMEAFPAGLIAGAWLFVPRRRRAIFVAGALALSATVYLWHDREPVVALGWAFAAVLGAVVAGRGVGRPGPTVRAALLTEEDLRRFVTHTFLGSAVAGALVSVVAAATGFTTWWLAGVGVALAHFATYLVILPHFLGRPRFPGVSSVAERVVQWICTVSFTVVAFLPLDLGPGVAFCIIPFLGWSALRAPMRETLVQLLVVATLSHAMTMQGLGPFAVDATTSPMRAELVTMAYALFVVACALTTIPFSLAVGVQRRESWHARQEQARVRQLVQSAGVAIIGTDAQGHINLFNPGAEAMFGYEASEVMGLVPSIFFTQGEVERLAAVLGTRPHFVDVAYALANSSTESLDVDFLHKDGSTITLQFSMSRIFNDDGKVLGYVSTGEDVTDRVKRQQALEEALAHERLAVENLKEVDQVKDALVSGVSHELRTPITSILGYLEMLEEGGFGPLGEAQARALARVKGNSSRLLALIDDLLVLSQIQDGYLAVQSTRLDLRAVVSEARGEVAGLLRTAGLELRVDLPPEPVVVLGDAERLGQVLVNLLVNATKFTDPGGHVAVGLEVREQEAVLCVSDTGIGIPEEEQEQLFERFFRASSARERAIQGSGLGLSIARALVQSHGGRIEVDSQVDVGSTFRISLPLEETLSQVEAEPAAPAVPQAGVPVAERTGGVGAGR